MVIYLLPTKENNLTVHKKKANKKKKLKKIKKQNKTLIVASFA